MDSKQLFSTIRNNQINFDDVVKRQNGFLNKLSNIKIGKKTLKKEVINNLEKLYFSREEVINLFKDYEKLFLDAAYKSKENETKGTGFKI